MKKISFLLIITLSLFVLVSCKIKKTSKEEYVDLLYRYHTLMKEENVCIDLRDLNQEYANGHIKGFINYNYQNGSDEEFLIYMKQAQKAIK